MLQDVFPLDVIQNMADLIRSVVAMVEKRDEVGNCPLEIDVVLPKRVIGIDEQILAGRELLGGRGGHACILPKRVMGIGKEIHYRDTEITELVPNFSPSPRCLSGEFVSYAGTAVSPTKSTGLWGMIP